MTNSIYIKFSITNIFIVCKVIWLITTCAPFKSGLVLTKHSSDKLALDKLLRLFKIKQYDCEAQFNNWIQMIENMLNRNIIWHEIKQKLQAKKTFCGYSQIATSWELDDDAWT